MKRRILSIIFGGIVFISSSLAVFAQAGRVTASVLNIRSAPSTQSEILGTYWFGTNINLLNREGDWYKIDLDGREAFVHANYIQLVDESLASRAGEVSDIQSAVLTEAINCLGVPYVYGGRTMRGFDCSGLVRYVYGRVGISLGHSSYAQAKQGRAISRDELRIGDLVFFRNNGHVGIYVGNDQYIHAPQSGRVVSYSSLSARGDLCGIRRVIND